ncbi:nuclear transport factor 2 family protein [Gluconacetobacter sp. Hr-1-5]|uniref:nuclear transport factor 2 family protein n=1 Tax=Gluconacetobacter sp. Hr-1-5 TaxID=3395370 RepID=UPI003B527BA3
MLSIDARLARIEAIEAIRAQVARYAIAADRGNDPMLFEKLYAETATWEARGFGRYEGRSEILPAMVEIGRTRMLWTTHYNVAPLIEVDDDLSQARCRWYLWELARMAQPDGVRDQWIAGTYDTRLARHGEEWLFVEVNLDLRLITGTSQPSFGDKRNV